MKLRLDKLSTKDSELNVFLTQNQVSPKKIYQFFEEDQLTEFMLECQQKAKLNSLKLGLFQLKESKESKLSDPSNTRAGMDFKYFGELGADTSSRHGLGF